MKYFSTFSGIGEAIKLYECGLTQIEIAEKLNTTQKVIWRAFKNANYKCRVAKKRNQFGENNDNWKGNSAKYAALHYRIYKLKGNPKKCELCGTTSAKKFEWANLTGKFQDPNDYKRMCGSCHAKYDKKIRNIIKIF